MNLVECAVIYNKATMDTRQFPSSSSSSSSGPAAAGGGRREFPAAFRGGQGARGARGGAAEPYTRRYYEEQRRNAEHVAARAAAAEAAALEKSREMNEINFPVLAVPPVGGTHHVWEHRATDLAAAWSEADKEVAAREQARIEAARSERRQFSGTQYLVPASHVNRMPSRPRHKYSGAGAAETYEEEAFAPPAPAPVLSPDESGWTVVDSHKKGRSKNTWKTTAAEEEQDTSTWDQGPQATEEGDESVW